MPLSFRAISTKYYLIAVLCLTGVITFYLANSCTNTSTMHPLTMKSKKPMLLLWFWPENYIFNFSDCKTLLNIDGCFLTDDRSQYSKADAVLIFHKAIKPDLSNLPPSTRPVFQRWIWLHVESPTNTKIIPGLEKLFNLTLSYRQDADIVVRNHLRIREVPEKNFVIPPKNKLVCWIVSNTNPTTGTDIRKRYFRELRKYIRVHVFGKASGHFLKYEDYYPTIASCKFYLSFENSIHKDYITEKLNGPLAVGTVPVVLGPPRENYENFVPSSSFIHVHDFASPRELAQYLHHLNRNERLYEKYFEWRKNFFAKPHLVLQYQEFILPICTACDYISKHHEYKIAKDIYKWYFS